MGRAQRDKSVISRRIKELREGGGETQQKLADILNISKQSLSKIEQDKMTLTLENAVNLANYYQVSVDWIAGRIDEKNNPIETLDILTKYIKYTSRNPFYFEKNRLKDDDPFVSLKINAALHKYLVGIVKAEDMLKYDDLKYGAEISKMYIKGITKTFLEDIDVLNWNAPIPIVDQGIIKYPENSDSFASSFEKNKDESENDTI